MKSLKIETLKVGGKIIKIFEDHAVALKAWSEILLGKNEPMLLLTLDSHTDTHGAFASYSCQQSNRTDWSDWEKYSLAKLNACDVSAPESLDLHLQDLKNDEHISAAIQLNLFDAAIILAYDGTATRSIEYDEVFDSSMAYFFRSASEVAPRPHTYRVPDDKIFYLPNICASICEKMPHDDDCTKQHADYAIESIHLSVCLSHADEMIVSLGRTEGLFQSNFILDIDLDYFCTDRSLAPSCIDEFNRLVRASHAITIAIEPLFVESCRIDETVSADSSLKILLEHIKKALGE